ncbi:high-affinity methionine permease [Exidia glandulosa HHB12029]|uniref:High-affinity methionine permease n=1 Tax=Exidia glandulosa HHB12029 TaxID=1314781 RepID=A0A165QCS1_EXIGL|nr:high-affinity methionine permease [Exidia glandulosa HHB12029]
MADHKDLEHAPAYVLHDERGHDAASDISHGKKNGAIVDADVDAGGHHRIVSVANDTTDGESFDQVPESQRRLSTFSAIMLAVGRIIGTGIFATPASILGSVGSPGMALILWVIGAIIAAAGAAVYAEWGTALPRSGGEKNYLEYFFRRPLFLISCVYAANAALLGWPSGNSVFAGEMILSAAGQEVTQWNQRAIGLGVITFALLVHSIVPKWGIRLQNALGVFKLVVLLFIIFSGFVALGGHIPHLPPGTEKPHNLRNAFAGTKTSANAFVTALYNVIWSFIGYSNLNYALSEVRHPVRTLKRALPISIGIIAVLYILVNIAFFAAIPKEDILTSNRLVAALFMRNMFGESAEKAVSVLIALSAIGNVLAVLFSQGRINQELGREGVLPLSALWASNKPFGAPAAGLALQWAVSLIVMLAPPPGDAYGFLLNLISYPLNVFNTLISGALLVLHIKKRHYGQAWTPPFSAPLPVVAFFFLASLFLVIAPLVPPEAGGEPYKSLPYWLHVVVGFGILAAGGVYWVIWTLILPRLGGYRLERHEEVSSDGITRNVFRRVYSRHE